MEHLEDVWDFMGREEQEDELTVWMNSCRATARVKAGHCTPDVHCGVWEKASLKGLERAGTSSPSIVQKCGSDTSSSHPVVATRTSLVTSQTWESLPPSHTRVYFLRVSSPSLPEGLRLAGTSGDSLVQCSSRGTGTGTQDHVKMHFEHLHNLS